MVSKIIKGTSVVFALLLAGLAVLITKPWDDFQSWRWFTLPAERTRSSVFRHWEVIQPTAQLAGASTPRVYARNALDPIGITYEYDGQQHAVTEYFERANIAGFMVLADDEVRLEYYAKEYTPSSLSHIWSATKSFTATLVGMALHDGTIESLDDPVQKYASQFGGTEYGPTSIRHVMMMSSGVDFKHFGWEPDRNDMYRAILHKGEDFDAWAAALGRRVPAGTDFNYIATDTHVLSAVLRGAYEKPFLEIVQEKLWEPGGFGAAQWGKDHHGNAMGHCCLSVTLQDFANLGQLYLDDLIIDGSQTVNNDWINMVEHAQAEFQEPHYEVNENGGKSLLEGYSFQFWLPLDYDQEFMAKGAFGQYLWIDRKNDFVVAQFSTGQSMITLKGQAAIKPEEFAAVARAMKALNP